MEGAMPRTSLLVVLGLTAGACATSPRPPAEPPALCVFDRGDAPAGAARGPWIPRLIRGYDPTTHRVTSPAIDCTGAQARWESPALRCADVASAGTAFPERPITEADVVTSDIGRESTLVWIPTTSYASGDAAGPVAMVARSPSQLRVVAIGVLRSFPRNAKLRLERLGETKVLVAEGDLCTPGEPASCARFARVVPLVESRFVPMPLVGEDRRCRSAALLELSKRERRRVRRGWELVELSTALAFGADGLTVQEQVVVHDLGESERGEPLRVLHRAQSSRVVKWEHGRMVTSGSPLWSRIAPGMR
jgi:hypothetical protein